MPIPHKYINTPDDAYEAETSYYLHFQLVSALISLDHIYNCKYSDSDLFESKAQYYHYYTDHLLYSLGQIAERFRESNNPNSTNDYFVRRSANRINYGFDKNNYPILSNKAFRNTIEHIDEHNIEVIKKHDAVGGFNTIDENTPEERKDTLRNKRNNHTYTLDLLLKRLYIEREDTPLTMNLDDLKVTQDYFKNEEHRDPTETEIKVLDTYWSDHCRHTTFATVITDIDIQNGAFKEILEKDIESYKTSRHAVYGVNTTRPLTLMDLATISMKELRKKGYLDDMEVSEEINACSIEITVHTNQGDEQWLLMFKNETHNHPTEIEPFGGAATCLGGAIRDPLSGRAYVYQSMRITGAGDPRKTLAETTPGKLPQRKICQEAAHGFSSYGNQIGLTTGYVHEIYDEGYIAKRMEVGAVVAAAPKEQVKRLEPQNGQIVLLIGGRTGRDGIGGATGSSKSHDVKSIETAGAEVQKGNPVEERKIQRLFRNKAVSEKVVRCNDFGAGGVCVAVGELAPGLDIDLDAVLKKYDGLTGTELAISESQERMAIVVNDYDVDFIKEECAKENLEVVQVATVTDTNRLVMKHMGKDIVNISRDFLDAAGAKRYQNIEVELPNFESTPFDEEERNDFVGTTKEVLSRLSVASQKGLVERFDSTIGAGTILMPFGGKNQMTPAEVMAAKIPLLKGETTTGTLMSYGYNPTVAKWSPFHSAVYAVVESVAKIVAGGGDYDSVRLTFQEYFERLGEDSHRWGKPFSALLGAYLAQIELGTAAIGGKDSMSGTFKDLDVPPTLVSFAVDPVKMYNVISPEFKNAGNTIVKVSVSYDENDLPVFDELKKNFVKISELVKESKIVSAATIGVGGIAAAVTKMAFGNDIGAVINEEDLFNYNYGSFVLELACDKAEAEKLFAGYNFAVIGNTTSEKSIVANGVTIDLDEALNIWIKPLEKIFPTKYLEEVKKADIEIKPFNVVEKKFSGKGIAAPRVLIPVFPGNNCEYDTKRAFEKAGAVADTLVVTNLKTQWLEESIDKMVDMIHNSQIIMIPGGFSAGDEPEGSGKFIAAVFRNPKVKEAVMDLLKNRDGLMLGILPFGEIRDMEENSPTLTFNTIGRHISCLADTKIVSNKSPWLWNSNVGDIHKVAFSHGEGRFMADEAVIKALAENNQIATQYVDPNGNPTFDIRYNPNGSLYAIEGITSPDGRVLGKMGHSERMGNGVFKNVPGEKDQKIFLSGVQYFK